MRYRIFTGQRQGRVERQMAFQLANGNVYLLKFLRDMFHPLAVRRLEDVTGPMVGLTGETSLGPIASSTLTDPVDVYNQAMQTLPAIGGPQPVEAVDVPDRA